MKNENPNISFIVPILNGERTIETCLKAILNQMDLEKDEVVVVDCGSTDKTLSIIKAFKDVKLFHSTRKSAASARNIGAQKARNFYLNFLDCDIRVLENYVDRLRRAIKRGPSDVVVFKVEPNKKKNNFFHRYREIKYQSKSDKMIQSLKKMSFFLINSANFLISKKAFNHLQEFDSKLKRCEDTEFSERLFLSGFPINFIDEVGSIVYPGNLNFFNYLARSYKTGVATHRFNLTRGRAKLPGIREFFSFQALGEAPAQYKVYNFINTALYYFGCFSGRALSFKSKHQAMPYSLQPDLLSKDIIHQGRSYRLNPVKRFIIFGHDFCCIFDLGTKETQKIKQSAFLALLLKILNSEHIELSFKEFTRLNALNLIWERTR